MCCHNIITGNCQINLANAPDVNKFFDLVIVTARISGFTVTKVYMQPHFSQPDARWPRDPVANVAGQRRAEQLHSDLENNLRIAFS